MLFYSTDAIHPGQNRILLFSSPEKALLFSWSRVQKQYLERSFKEARRVVLMNHFDSMDIVALPDEGKSGYPLRESLRLSGNEIHELACRNKWEEAVLFDLAGDSDLTEALLEGMALSNYQFLKYLSKQDDKRFTFSRLGILNGQPDLIRDLNIRIESVGIARDLVNEPVSFLTAPKLADQVQKMGLEAGLQVEILDQSKIRALKMGGLLAVNRGSTDPPRFIILNWEPETAVNKSPLVLVGKGITFDTGGLSLKPTPNSMDEMKSDMAGAAAVASTLIALARLNCPVRVIGLIPATDNRPDGNAYAPGDVIFMHDGTSVEVLNCDAEGRLILADALSYAKKYDPDLIIDLATLTGSAQAALGPLASAAMGTASDKDFRCLEEAGFETWERIVRLPLWEDYGKMLESEIADLKNIGGRYAGAITAGKFLEHFTSSPWIHIDIAGTAFLTSREGYRGIGATGTGVRLILNFIKKRYLD